MSRSFTIHKVNSKNRKLKSKKNVGGRFESSNPSAAAKKAGSSICRKKNLKSADFSLTIKETTQGSSHKLFPYKFSRRYNPVTVSRAGVPVTYNYETRIKSVHKRSDGAGRSRSLRKKRRRPVWDDDNDNDNLDLDVLIATDAFEDQPPTPPRRGPPPPPQTPPPITNSIRSSRFRDRFIDEMSPREKDRVKQSVKNDISEAERFLINAKRPKSNLEKIKSSQNDLEDSTEMPKDYFKIMNIIKNQKYDYDMIPEEHIEGYVNFLLQIIDSTESKPDRYSRLIFEAANKKYKEYKKYKQNVKQEVKEIELTEIKKPIREKLEEVYSEHPKPGKIGEIKSNLLRKVGDELSKKKKHPLLSPIKKSKDGRKRRSHRKSKSKKSRRSRKSRRKN